jgi:hypothetical protein
MCLNSNNTLTEHCLNESIITTIYKIVARNLDTAYPINETKGVHEVLLSYFETYRFVSSAKDRFVLLRPYLSLIIIKQSLTIASAEKQNQMYPSIWCTFQAIVMVLDSPSRGGSAMPDTSAQLGRTPPTLSLVLARSGVIALWVPMRARHVHRVPTTQSRGHAAKPIA